MTCVDAPIPKTPAIRYAFCAGVQSCLFRLSPLGEPDVILAADLAGDDHLSIGGVVHGALECRPASSALRPRRFAAAVIALAEFGLHHFDFERPHHGSVREWSDIDACLG